MERPPTIWLSVEHGCPEMSRSLYIIQPPIDLSDYDQMIDSQGFIPLSPVLTLPDKNTFMKHSALLNLGSKIYFFGGVHNHPCLPSSTRPSHLSYQVQVFDTDHPDQGIRILSPMNGPKDSPCVFVADGMIYALGAALRTFNRPGFFERYDPSSDPPLHPSEWVGAKFMDRATVVGRRVYISSFYHIIFNLDTHKWDPLPPQELALRFPYGSIFVNDSVSLYYLQGPGSCKPGVFIDSFRDPVQVVKRGPLTTSTKLAGVDNTLFMNPCLAPGKEQLMADANDLDDNAFFTNSAYYPWRDLFHMGGRFFCYVVTSPLFDHDNYAIRQPNSRGVWIKFFEEVPHTDHNKTKFRSLASFGYKIDSDFSHMSSFIRCSVFGTVPDSWIIARLEKKQESKLKLINKENTIAQDQAELLDNTQNREMLLKKLLADREEEISRLASELAKKNERLKSYEALFAKNGGMSTRIGS
ncbi:hypothetical protein RND81_08G196500 [Saponaria officinalis]